MKCTSWLMKMSVPSYWSNADTSASMLAMSRCVVGSSMSSRFGGLSSSLTSPNRLFSPPLNTDTDLNTSSPRNRKLPSTVRVPVR